jgi:3-oxoacyl-[acyl-carrier protein] reductase
MAVSSGFREGDAIVVSGAGQGIGRAIALDNARRGARLALWDCDPHACATTAEACKALGAQAISSTVDISDCEQVFSAARFALAKFGVIFGLVNNAGIFPRATVLESTPALWSKVLGVNLMGAVFSSQALVPCMIEARRGAIINVASGRALQGTPRGAHYAASKAAVVSFTKSLALETASHGVRVNCIIPGLTETAQPLADASSEELNEVARRTIPMGRIGQPEDLTAAIHFLMSDGAAFVTGQSLAVNGGAIMIP